jgi:MSHA biogenesis protein MshL
MEKQSTSPRSPSHLNKGGIFKTTGKDMSRLKNSDIQKLHQTTANKGSIRPWAVVLVGCLMLVACNSSKIKSSKTHFLRPTDPPVYLNAGAGNPEINDSLQDARLDNEKPEEVYTITVTEMSVRDLLFALARDAGVNIDIYPGIDGRVTLSAIDQTLPQILDRISKQVAIRYEISENAIIVSPDLPFLKIYEVDYINIKRSSNSSNEVSTRLSTANMNEEGDDKTDESNLSTTSLDTSTSNKFWKTLSNNIETILNPDVKKRAADPAPQTAEGGKEVAGDMMGLIPNQLDNNMMGRNRPAELEVKKTGIMALNAEAGQISIFASAAQHERIKELVDSIMGSVHRQVMIESTVVEVELSDRFQEGVDWDIMFNSAADIGLKGVFSKAINNTSSTVGELFSLGRDPNPTATSSVTSTKAIRAAIKVLETFGNTKVLSSPKIMALNNQPAILKVVKNKVFFTMKSNSSTTNVTGDNNTTSTPTFDTKIHTVPVGLIMSVTPHISRDGIVTMNVRPTITRVTSEISDPNPALKKTTANGFDEDIVSAIPEIEVKEMETIMRIHSGQVAVMGGLMQDQIDNDSAGIPGLGRVPGLGFFFSHKDRTVKKTELVIFLRPVIIGHDQPKTPPRRMARRPLNGHLAVDQRGTQQQSQMMGNQQQQQQQMMGNQPREDSAPTPMAGAPRAPAPAAAQSYLDFTSPQGFNGAQRQPAPAPFSNQQQPASNGIAPPPPMMPPTPSQASYQPLAYPQDQPIQKQKQGYFVDLGSYLERTHANDVQRKINAIGLPIQQESALVEGQSYQRVRSGPFPDQTTATQAMAKITNYTGIQARVARF